MPQYMFDVVCVFIGDTAFYTAHAILLSVCTRVMCRDTAALSLVGTDIDYSVERCLLLGRTHSVLVDSWYDSHSENVICLLLGTCM